MNGTKRTILVADDEFINREILSEVLKDSYELLFAETGTETLEQISENSFSCSFDGVKHRFLLYLPDEPAGAPLVVMLPGYGNTAESFRTAVHFEVEAKACGYAVVYVTGAPDPNSPTSAVGWHSELGTDGNRDAEFLVSLTEVLQAEYSLDPKNAYVIGFSNGGLMVHRLSAEASDTFSAFVSVITPLREHYYITVFGVRHLKQKRRAVFFYCVGALRRAHNFGYKPRVDCLFSAGHK